MFSRIKEHCKDKNFDSYSYLEIESKDEADDLEKRYIDFYKPKYNAKIGQYNYVSVEELCEKYKLDEEIVRELLVGETLNGKYVRFLNCRLIEDYLKKEYENSDEYKEYIKNKEEEFEKTWRQEVDRIFELDS